MTFSVSQGFQGRRLDFWVVTVPSRDHGRWPFTTDLVPDEIARKRAPQTRMSQGKSQRSRQHPGSSRSRWRKTTSWSVVYWCAGENVVSGISGS
jgi:hypothetical protein